MYSCTHISYSFPNSGALGNEPRKVLHFLGNVMQRFILDTVVDGPNDKVITITCETQKEIESLMVFKYFVLHNPE